MEANAAARTDAGAAASSGIAAAPWRTIASRYSAFLRAASSGSGWRAAAVRVTTIRGAGPAADGIAAG